MSRQCILQLKRCMSQARGAAKLEIKYNKQNKLPTARPNRARRGLGLGLMKLGRESRAGEEGLE